MKNATLCVDELTLHSVGLPLHADHALLPILSTANLDDAKEMDAAATAVDDGASEAATVRAEDEEDDDNTASGASMNKSVEPSATSMALSFMERMVREYSLKREIHALISKKQQQLRTMQALIITYQDQLLKAIAGLEDEAQQQHHAGEVLQKETRKRLAEVLATGGERALVESTRALGLVQLQRHRILRARTKLRTTVITTRQEECAWLLKSIVTQNDRECESLLAAISNKKYLEEGSLQATLAVQITQDDPIFASVETLFETQPVARQLQLQLDSVDAVVVTMGRKRDELERKNVVPTTGPVPLVKRSSFRERRQDGGYPTSDRKRLVRLCLIEGKRVRSYRTGGDFLDRHRRYTPVLVALGRLLSDARTRSGRLLHQFVEKLHDDTLTPVRVTTTLHREVEEESNQTDESNPQESKRMHVFLQERYLLPRLPAILETVCVEDVSNGEATVLVEEPAVDTLKLPPPAMIAAFAKFLTRVVTTEYELLAASPSAIDELTDDKGGDENLDDQSFEDAMDQSVLQDCVHEMVFQRITTITFASAIDEYRFARQDEMDNGSNKFLFPWHWHHSKALLQGIAPAELAFPEEAMTAVTGYLKRHDQDVRAHGFLPKTLSLFRTAELETTPKGVVRAVMAGFKMLHREIINVLSAEKASPTKPEGGGMTRRRPQRRGSSFLNADILIPSVVLMMSRLPRPDYLDRLWHRALLVEAFRGSALSDGGEEAYYLTCLAAAMEFINTLQVSNPEMPEECTACETLRSELLKRNARIEPLGAAAAVSSSSTSPPSPTPGRPRLSRTTQAVGVWSKQEHESIKQLSKWISDQPPTDSSITIGEHIERFIVPHELWCSEAFTSSDA